MSWVRSAELGSLECALLASALLASVSCGSGSETGQAGAGAPIMMTTGGSGAAAGASGLAGMQAAGMDGWVPVAGTGLAGMGAGAGLGGVGAAAGGEAGVGLGGASGLGASGLGGAGVGDAGAGGAGLGGTGVDGSGAGGVVAGVGGAPPATGGGPAPNMVTEGMPTHVPTPKGTCPDIRTGSVNITLNGATVQFRLWVGSGMGPALIYWHGTGGSSAEATSAMRPAVDAVQSSGGMVAAPEITSGTGTTTGNLVWYTGDIDFADEVLACAIQQGKVDPARIHVAGYSAGGLQTVHHWYARNGYVASVLSYSGGDSFINIAPRQNPNWAPPAIAAHGAEGADWLAIDFAAASTTWLRNVAAAGGLAVQCNDGGGHISATRFSVAAAAWQFFRDHPWGVAAPYASLPAAFPNYCMILR